MSTETKNIKISNGEMMILIIASPFLLTLLVLDLVMSFYYAVKYSKISRVELYAQWKGSKSRSKKVERIEKYLSISQ